MLLSRQDFYEYVHVHFRTTINFAYFLLTKQSDVSESKPKNQLIPVLEIQPDNMSSTQQSLNQAKKRDRSKLKPIGQETQPQNAYLLLDQIFSAKTSKDVEYKFGIFQNAVDGDLLLLSSFETKSFGILGMNLISFFILFLFL